MNWDLLVMYRGNKIIVLLVYCMTAQMMTTTLKFITLVDKFNNSLNDDVKN